MMAAMYTPRLGDDDHGAVAVAQLFPSLSVHSRSDLDECRARVDFIY
jgi:hypothetical protein